MDPATEALKQFLGEYIVAVAILIIALAWFIWWLSSKYHSMKSRVEKMDDLPCNAHEQSLSRVSERIEENGRIMYRIEDRLDTLPCGVHNESLSKISERLDETGRLMAVIENRLNTLPCSSHADKHDKHEERLNNSESLLHKMEGQLELLVNNSIMKSTEKIRSRSGHTFSAKHSPRVLNQNGEALLNECGGKEFLDKNMDIFIDKIRKMQPKTALDVENLAIAVMKAATIEDIFNPIKDWVYNAPIREVCNPDGSTSEIEVTLEDIVFVLSLPVRDKYLEQYPM